MDQASFTYLALGDSYTIGEAVETTERWPVQLVSRLKKSNVSVGDPHIIATTGWTTSDLRKGIADAGVTQTYDLVSLLIGVNNQYRGYDLEIYKKEFAELLDQAIEFAAGMEENVFVISIPDYGVTSFASDKKLDAIKIANEIKQYNQEAENIAKAKGVIFFDITEWSKKAAQNASLVTTDGLHPSEKMYKNWVDTCYDWALSNLVNR